MVERLMNGGVKVDNDGGELTQIGVEQYRKELERKMKVCAREIEERGGGGPIRNLANDYRQEIAEDMEGGSVMVSLDEGEREQLLGFLKICGVFQETGSDYLLSFLATRFVV